MSLALYIAAVGMGITFACLALVLTTITIIGRVFPEKGTPGSGKKG